jgi:DNA ligase-4
VSDSDSKRRICFQVFDVLLLNGNSLINETLETRSQILRQVFSEKATFLEILSTKVGSTVSDLEKSLFEALESGEEGLMVKDPHSFYDPGSRKNWYKVKPDYFDSLCDDLDVVLVGAYFGEGRAGGIFSSFVRECR